MDESTTDLYLNQSTSIVNKLLISPDHTSSYSVEQSGAEWLVVFRLI